MLAALRKGQDFFQVMAPDTAFFHPLIVEFHHPHGRAFFAKVTKSAAPPSVR